MVTSHVLANHHPLFFQKAASSETFLCGIHSVNAFFKAEVIKENDEDYLRFLLQRQNQFENLSVENQLRIAPEKIKKFLEWSHIEDLVQYMVELAKNEKVSSEYINLDYKEIIIENTENIAQKAFAQLSKVLNGDEFIFLYGAHYVTFLKTADGWFLLDDQNEGPEKILGNIKNRISSMIEKFNNASGIFTDIAVIAKKELLN